MMHILIGQAKKKFNLRPATFWWEIIMIVLHVARVFTWEDFKKTFREAHVPESMLSLSGSDLTL